MAGLEYSARLSAASLRELYKDAAAAPGIHQIELRRGVKKAGTRVQKAVRDRAATFSRKIPPKVKVKASFAARGAGVRIVVDDPSGEAGALNNRDRSGKFRHPVFGSDNWVSQTAHPFFVTAAHPAALQAADEIRGVMDDIARKLGFH